jgi:hypothetical protein
MLMRLLDQCITVGFLLLAIFLGLPCALLGIIGISGGLTDTSDLENRRLGLALLSLAATILGGNWLWFGHLRRKLVRVNGASSEGGSGFDDAQPIESDLHD